MAWLDEANQAVYQPYADYYADKYSIPRKLFNAMIYHESGWGPYRVSPAGAIGLGQLMPGTARDLGVDPWNPIENLKGAADYLSQQFKRFGTWAQALAAYNGGPGNVNIAETRQYAQDVLAIAGDFGDAQNRGAYNKDPALTKAEPPEYSPYSYPYSVDTNPNGKDSGKVAPASGMSFVERLLNGLNPFDIDDGPVKKLMSQIEAPSNLPQVVPGVGTITEDGLNIPGVGTISAPSLSLPSLDIQQIALYGAIALVAIGLVVVGTTSMVRS